MPLGQTVRFIWHCFLDRLDCGNIRRYKNPNAVGCVMASVKCAQSLTVGTCTKIGTLHSLEIIHLCIQFCRNVRYETVIVV